MKNNIKKFFRKFGIEVTRYAPHVNASDDYRQVISLKPGKNAIGNVLLSYILQPFLLKDGEPFPNTHNNYWRSLHISQTFLELGYSVDVIDYRNRTFMPEKNYAFFIDVRHNLERLSPYLNKDCIKIMHIDHAHILFHNKAEATRLLELQQRKGITLRPRRFEIPNLAIEHADCATIAANEFAISTFRYANKPIYRIPQPSCVVFPWSENKNYDGCRHSFLWFNSGGLVHKGLDLVLDAFAEMPDCHLYVCGPVEREKDFEKAYYSELHKTHNIHTIGWVDIESTQFINVANQCIGIVNASCSEGGGGSIIQCMHAGLIPIVNYETSVDINDSYGIMLENCSVDTIKARIRMVANFPAERLQQMSRKAWEYARAHHTREKFAEEYKKTVLKIINDARI